MKTQIITLESHDDLISVRDKLSWVKTPRVLLVWPKYENVSLRLLDLKVLQRHTDSLGAQLGLVTRIGSVRRDAESLGIPVFESSASAQKDHWPDSAPRQVRTPKPPRTNLRADRDSLQVKESAWQTSLVGRVIIFSAGVIAFLAVAGLFVPRAAVTIYSEAKIQSIIIPVAAGESNSNVLITGQISAETLSVIVNDERSVQITSRIPIPKTKAKGIVRFENRSQADVQIDAGTIIETTSQPPIQFVTLNDTLLAAGEDEFVDVPVEALLPGANGNVLEDAVANVAGPLGLSLTVSNPQPIKGGADEMQVGAGNEDRTALKDVLFAALRNDAETKLRAQIAPNDLLLMDTFEVVNILNETYLPETGQPGETLTLKMQVEYSARYVKGENLRQLTSLALAAVDEDFTSAGDENYKVITEPSSDTNDITHFEIQVSRTLLRATDFFAVYSSIRGMDLESARENLAAISTRQPAEIVLSPSWWPRLPLIPFNISVAVQ